MVILRYNVKYFETSAKQNLGVTEAFESITSDVVERLTSGPDNDNGGGGGGGGGKKLNNGQADPKKSGGCC